MDKDQENILVMKNVAGESMEFIKKDIESIKDNFSNADIFKNSRISKFVPSNCIYHNNICGMLKLL